MPRAVQVSAPLAVVATLSAVTMGVLAATPETSDADLLAASASSAAPASADLFANSTSVANRGELGVSRSQTRTAARAEAAARREMAADRREVAADRREGAAQKAAQQATRRAVRSADATLWTTEELNLWDGSGEQATQLGLVDAVEKVLVTGRREAGRAEIVVDGIARWVSADYLSADKPELGPNLGGTCANGSSVSAGRASLYTIHDVVCANWPQITSYGTWRGDGDHGEGRAIDIMVSGETGWAVADFLRANYAALGIEYIIYSQNIWSVERGGEGWRGMSDRGSTTANHYDHVHVTVY